jgi:hypothetical protein
VTRKNITWQPDSDGSVPTDAMQVGKARNGEMLYMGRVEYENSLTPGKVRILTCLQHETNVVRWRNAFASSCMLCDFVICKPYVM